MKEYKKIAWLGGALILFGALIPVVGQETESKEKAVRVESALPPGPSGENAPEAADLAGPFEPHSQEGPPFMRRPGPRGLIPDGRRTDRRTGRRTGLLPMLMQRRDELGISDDQLKSIMRLSFQMEERLIKQRNAAGLQRLEIKKLLMNREERDYEKIRNLMDELSSARVEARIEGMKRRDRIRDVLTPEQREALRESARERMAEREGPMRSRGKRPLPRIRREREAR